jgi:hypothetical protein
MKKLPSILSFSAVIGLVLLLVSAALGVSVPFARIASGIVEFSVVAGMLGFFLADYAAPRSLDYDAVRVTEPKREAAPVAVRQRRIPDPVGLPFDEAITANLMATLEMRNDPATVSLV